MKLSDSAYVFENGSAALEGASEELLNDERLRGAYLGE